MELKIYTGTRNYASNFEKDIRNQRLSCFKNSPIPDDQVLSNLGLFLSSKDLARILFMDYIYKKILDVQGIIFDFGTRWGHNMALFAALRGIYEPFNRHRKIVGFDTFAGFPSISEKDGHSDLMQVGNVTVTENYKSYLDQIMHCQEQDNPLNHIKKYDIIIGDASEEINKYFLDNPHVIISLAYFDFDLYEPTKKCLHAMKTRLIKGSILAFDELNDHDSPGETLALMETIGLNNIRLKRYPYTSRISYFEVE